MDKIEMIYVPVPDLPKALRYYRDTLGWIERWREGDSTVAIGPSGSEVSLMLDVVVDGSAAQGPMLTVDSVRTWIDTRRDQLSIRREPVEIPGGWWACVEDPFGGALYVIDQSTADAPS